MAAFIIPRHEPVATFANRPDLATVVRVKLLFVCLGNICRSPAAEGVMAKLVADAGCADLWRIDSAGTIGLHAGDLPDHRMRGAAKKRGYALTSRARQLQINDLKEFDLVVAMDRSNLADIRRLVREGSRAELALFCDFCTKHPQTEVPDPYYGGADGFELVLDLLEDGCAEILRRWRDENRWKTSIDA
jgi:protein-tyrosine phosphatase